MRSYTHAGAMIPGAESLAVDTICNIKIRKGSLAIALIFSLLLSACGGGNGGSSSSSSAVSSVSSSSSSNSSSSSAAVTIGGVVAKGDPLASAVITVKAQSGATKTAISSSDGSFTVDVTGLSGPFLLRAVSSDGNTTLFSAATTSGTTNIHPFTDLALRAYYQAIGTTVASTFSNVGASTLLPGQIDLRNLAAALNSVLGPTLLKDSIATASAFNIFSTAFVANQTGFDLLLHDAVLNGLNFAITTGTLQQTVTVVPNSGSISFSNETSDSSTSTDSTSSFNVDVSATSQQQQNDEQAAIAGINMLWTNILNVVAQKGIAISQTDLMPFMDANFLDRGRDASFFTSQLAILLSELAQGQTLSLLPSGEVFNFSDPAGGVLTITAEVDLAVKNTGTGNSFFLPVFKYEDEIFNNDGRPGLVYVKESDGSYKLYGDHSLAYLALSASSTNFYSSVDTTHSTVFGLQAYAPFATPPSLSLPAGVGTVASITVTNNNGQLPVCSGAQPYALGATSRSLLAGVNGSGGALTLNGTELFLACNTQVVSITTPPPAGTQYAVTYTTPAAATNTITAEVHTQTSEVANLTTINGQVPATFLASNHTANIIDHQLALTWSLPTTFAVNMINVTCITFDILGNQFFLAPMYLAPTATAGSTATIPATLLSTGLATVDVLCAVNFIGVNGEVLTADFNVL